MNDQELKQNIFVSDTAENTIALPNAVHLRRRPIQNYLLIWIDESIDQSNKDYRKILTELQNVVNDINIFTELDKCIDFLAKIKDMKVFLITDGAFGQQIIPHIHDTPQLDIICILSENKCQHDEWTKGWFKIWGVYSDVNSVCETLQLAVKQCNNDSIAMSFISVSEEMVSTNLNQLEPSFMYTQIFKEILLEMKHDAEAIRNLATYWRELYNGNMNQLKTIDEFERDYRPEMSISWYTRASFIYEILNRALRNLESDLIINMSFFIHDLHRQIEVLNKKQASSYHGKSFAVYRGQGILASEFQKLEKTQGGLMSFNNFLSTSKNPDVARIFAESNLNMTNRVGILFRMTIDPSIISTPYADIYGNSYFEAEEEILFSMHAVFRIGEITKLDDNNRLYQVDLKLTADDDEQLRNLTERIREEVAGPTEWQRMGNLQLKIGQFDKAEKLYKVLLEQTSDLNTKAHYYNQLGYIADDQGDFKKAIQYYEEGIQIRKAIVPLDEPLLATSFNNIGVAHRNMGEYSEALLFHQKALEIREKVLPSNHLDIAQSCNNIGTLYVSIGKYAEALPFYEKALQIREIILTSNHPDTAQSYNNIGIVYQDMEQRSKALSFYQKACEIFEKTLPKNHSTLATCYNNIGEGYREMEEYSKALPFYQKALEIRQESLPSNHPDMAQSFNNIGVVYEKMEEYSKALLYHDKARAVFENISPNPPELGVSYINIARVYRTMKKYSEALSFSERAREFLEKTVARNHIYLAVCYENIGLVYHNMTEHSKALSHLTDALDIYQRLLSSDHSRIQRVQSSIEMVKNSTK